MDVDIEESGRFSAGIYRRFEDKFRGSRESVLGRLKNYIPLLEKLEPHIKANNYALDLGCGRGEWLELLQSEGWHTLGVDSNEGMLEPGRDLGLTVIAGDALAHLRTQPDRSIGVLSAFHLVEHISTDYLILLLQECYRVLTDGGLLILETPNPENISVGTCGFFTDPTHIKPLPPPLLQFLAEDVGLKPAHIFRLNGERQSPTIGALGNAFRVMFTASYDYAVIAQKVTNSAKIDVDVVGDFVRKQSQANPANIGPFLQASSQLEKRVQFSVDGLVETLRQNESTGETLRQLVEQLTVVRQESQDLRNTLLQRDQEFATAQFKLTEITESNGVALRRLVEQLTVFKQESQDLSKALLQREQELATAQVKLAELTQSNHNWWSIADQMNRELQNVYASNSWRLTAPLRQAIRGSTWALAFPKRFVRAAPRTCKHTINTLIVWAIRTTLESRRLDPLARRILAIHPKLKQQLRQYAVSSGLISGENFLSAAARVPPANSGGTSTYGCVPPPNLSGGTLGELSPRASQIFLDLKKTVAERKR